MEEQIPLIYYEYTRESDIYASYMPFVEGGGLFLRIDPVYSLGQHVTIELQLVREPAPFFIRAKVIWITPKNAQNNKPFGIGIQFIGDNTGCLCTKLESYLTGLLQSEKCTDTF